MEGARAEEGAEEVGRLDEEEEEGEEGMLALGRVESMESNRRKVREHDDDDAASRTEGRARLRQAMMG